jgi:hypothetical protein
MTARRTVLLALIAFAAGCATTDTLEPGSGTTFEVRGRTYDQIWKAAVATASRQLTIVEQNRDTGTIKAESRVGLTTWGEVVGVFIRPAKPGAKLYTVEVQSQKRAKVQFTGQDWTQTMVSGIKSELGI